MTGMLQDGDEILQGSLVNSEVGECAYEYLPILSRRTQLGLWCLSTTTGDLPSHPHCHRCEFSSHE